METLIHVVLDLNDGALDDTTNNFILLILSLLKLKQQLILSESFVINE